MENTVKLEYLPPVAHENRAQVKGTISAFGNTHVLAVKAIRTMAQELADRHGCILQDCGHEAKPAPWLGVGDDRYRRYIPQQASQKLNYVFHGGDFSAAATEFSSFTPTIG